MRNSYIANTHEAAALNSGKQTAVVVKMKVQPTFSEDGYVYCGNFLERYKNDFFHEDWRVQFTKDFAPYKLGQEVYVREAWLYCHENSFLEGLKSRWVLKSMVGCDSWYIALKEKSSFYKWRSPATMPQSAARTRFKVVGVEVVRVRDLTVEQVCNAGKEYIPLYYSVTVQTYIVDKFGQQAWDENHFIWYFKIERV